MKQISQFMDLHEFLAGATDAPLVYAAAATTMASREHNRCRANLNLFALMDGVRALIWFGTRRLSMFDTRRPTSNHQKLMQYPRNIYIL